MPRLAFSTSENRHRKPPTERERFLFAVKMAGLVVVTGLVGGYVLLSGDGGDPPRVPRAYTAAPAPSDPATSGQLEPRQAPVETAPSTQVVMAPPVQRTATTAIVPSSAAAPKPKPKPPRQTPTRPGRPTLAVIGQQCPQPGTYSMTREYVPVVCRPAARTGTATWQPVF